MSLSRITRIATLRIPSYIAYVVILFFAILTAGIFLYGNIFSVTESHSLIFFQGDVKSALPYRRARLPEGEMREEISLRAVGDIMLSRVVGQKMIEHKNYTYPFLKTATFLRVADITFGNLETAVFPGRPVQTGEMLFRADPEALAGLNYAGFDIVSLANNHTPNFGETGLRDTFLHLDKAGIAYVGAGETEEAARAGKVLFVRGMRVGFLAYNDSDVVPVSYAAGESRAGTAFMDSAKMEEDVARLKTRAEIVIVSMHSGTEYTYTPNESQRAFAHAAIDAGAVLVIGHHPHWVQEVEKYHNGYIIYSLGNFVFDQMWSQETREGAIADIVLTKQGVRTVQIFPVIIEDYSQPAFAQEEVEKKIKRVMMGE